MAQETVIAKDIPDSAIRNATAPVYTTKFKALPFAPPVTTVPILPEDKYKWVSMTGNPKFVNTGAKHFVGAAPAVARMEKVIDQINSDPALRKVYGIADGETRPLAIYGGARDYAQQKILKDEAIARKDPGHAAAPGTSAHEGGFAFDVDVYDKKYFPTPASVAAFDKLMREKDADGGYFTRVYKKGKLDKSETHHYTYVNPKDGISTNLDAIRRSAENGSMAMLGQQDMSLYKKALTQGRDPKLASTGQVIDVTNVAAGSWAGNQYIPGAAGGLIPLNAMTAMQATLQHANDGTSTPAVKITEVKSNVGNFDEIQEYLSTKSFELDKLIKNAYWASPKHSDLGFESKMEVPAHIKLVPDPIRATKTEPDSPLTKLKNAGVDYIDGFILRSVGFVNEERYFPYQSLNGDTVVFFFGAKPVIYSFAGTLYNTKNQQWFNDFMFYYDNFLRGTKCIENKTRLFLMYQDQIVEGFMVDVKFNASGEMTDAVDISFNMIAIQKTILKTSTLDYKNPLERHNLKKDSDDKTQQDQDALNQHYKKLLEDAYAQGVKTVTGLTDYFKNKLGGLPSIPPIPPAPPSLPPGVIPPLPVPPDQLPKTPDEIKSILDNPPSETKVLPLPSEGDEADKMRDIIARAQRLGR